MIILLSRLFLNLRQIHIAPDVPSNASDMTSIDFSSRVIGPLGAPVDVAFDIQSDSRDTWADIPMRDLEDFPEDGLKSAHEEASGDSDDFDDTPGIRFATEPFQDGLRPTR